METRRQLDPIAKRPRALMTVPIAIQGDYDLQMEFTRSTAWTQRAGLTISFPVDRSSTWFGLGDNFANAQQANV